jgi:hypothetical protein
MKRKRGMDVISMFIDYNTPISPTWKAVSSPALFQLPESI